MTQKEIVFAFLSTLKDDVTTKEAESLFAKANPGFNMGNYNFYRNQAMKEKLWTPSDAKPAKAFKNKDPFKELKSALKQNKAKLVAMDSDGVRKWFDEFDPEGEIGHEVFSKILKDITGIKFKYHTVGAIISVMADTPRIGSPEFYDNIGMTEKEFTDLDTKNQK